MSKSPQFDPAQEARKINFSGCLENIHNGDFLKDLEAAHKDVVEHCMTRSGKCSITIKMEYKAGDDKAVAIAVDLDIKKPKKARRAQVFFAKDTGETFLDDPYQAELDMKPVIKFENRTVAREAMASGQ